MRHKFVRAEIKAIDEDAHTVDAIVSTESVDRDGDILRVAGWDLKNFRKHAPLLSSHDYRQLQSQIGSWPKMDKNGAEKTLDGLAHYLVGEGNPEADWAWTLVKNDLAAYSVGFDPDMEKAEQIDGTGFWPSFEFKGQELLEVSQVTVPANPEALQVAKAYGHSGIAKLADDVAHLLDDDPPPVPHVARTIGNVTDWAEEVEEYLKRLDLLTNTASGQITGLVARMDELTAKVQLLEDAEKTPKLQEQVALW